MRRDTLLSLRLWRDDDGAAPWRARLTDLRSGRVLSFPDVAALTAYLAGAFDEPPSDGEEPAAEDHPEPV
jgi:hypothetical protein